MKCNEFKFQIHKKCKIVFFTLVISFAQNSLALFENYNSIIIGDQAAGMGGAYTAKVGDAAASAFYNPATLALLKGNSFSAAVGIYKKFATNYGEADDFTQAALSVNQGFFRSIPASSGSVMKIDGWSLALSILVPDYDWYSGELKTTETVKSKINYTDESLWVGGAIAKKISKKESAGMTLYYTARNYSLTASDNLFPDGTQATLFSEDKNITHNALIAILGYQYQMTIHWSIGTSYRLPSYQIAGTGKYYSSTITTSPYVYTSVDKEQVAVINKIPAKFALGVAYDKPLKYSWAFDINYYFPEKYDDMGDESFSTNVEYRSVLNASMGMEYYLLDWMRIRLGGYTNFASHPDPDTTLQKRQTDRVDQLGFSANLAFLKDGITYTFGGYYTGGRGRSYQRVGGSFTEIDKTQQVFTMLVGTSFSF